MEAILLMVVVTLDWMESIFFAAESRRWRLDSPLFSRRKRFVTCTTASLKQHTMTYEGSNQTHSSE